MAYDKWCKELGSDIIYVRVAGQGMVVLNSLETIEDMLEKRSSTFSSRPRMPMTIEMMDCGWIFALPPYGRDWKERRRLFMQYFHPSRVEEYHIGQTKFAHSMLPRLLDRPENFLRTLQYTITSTAMSISYGIPILRENDPYVALAEETVRNVGDSALPTNFWVNFIPALKYVPEFVPGAGFKKTAREWKARADAFLEEPFRAAIKCIVSGEAKPSFVSAAMGDSVYKFNPEKGPSSEEKAIMDVAATALAGASDTTLASIKSFFASMLCFPEAQKKGQEELDRVLQGRLPTFEDEASLPYISAIVEEVTRWAVVTPVGTWASACKITVTVRSPTLLAVPHTSDEDEIYRGYFIPKGSIVLPNVWALLRDERRYGPNTSDFIPERFLKDGKLNADVMDPERIAFGYGRRECPGKHIALSYLFISIATILSTFNISEELDENGVPIPPKLEWHSGVICEPAPFKCTIRPRSKEAVKLIRALDTGARLD
ncbi:cytochrome P450 [Agrocybe pediades]|nr:cytochrome P450 [Agrocybe pediades]